MRPPSTFSLPSFSLPYPFSFTILSFFPIHTADRSQVDEFSMLYATSAILFAALSVTFTPQSRTYLSISVAFITFTTSIIHYRLDYTPGFQIVFGIMVFTVFCECVWLVKTRVDDWEVVSDMKKLAFFGAGTWLRVLSSKGWRC